VIEPNEYDHDCTALAASGSDPCCDDEACCSTPGDGQDTLIVSADSVNSGDRPEDGC